METYKPAYWPFNVPFHKSFTWCSYKVLPWQWTAGSPKHHPGLKSGKSEIESTPNMWTFPGFTSMVHQWVLQRCLPALVIRTCDPSIALTIRFNALAPVPAVHCTEPQKNGISWEKLRGIGAELSEQLGWGLIVVFWGSHVFVEKLCGSENFVTTDSEVLTQIYTKQSFSWGYSVPLPSGLKSKIKSVGQTELVDFPFRQMSNHHLPKKGKHLGSLGKSVMPS